MPRGLAWLTRLIPARYRAEVVGDLLDEYRGRRLWLAAHLLRSAVASRWHARPQPSPDHPRSSALDRWAWDTRLAWRALSRSPLFTAVAIGTSALAIGLSAAVFSLVNDVLLRPLPFPSSERLVRLAEFRPDRQDIPGARLADVTIGAWTAETRTLDAIVPYSVSALTVRTAAGADQIAVASVGARFFDALSMTPELGRVLVADDGRRDSPPVVVVSHRFWTTVLGSRPDVVGVSIQIDDRPFSVVGVVAEQSFPEPNIDIWKPGQWRFPTAVGVRQMGLSLEVFARLRPGADLSDAEKEGSAILRRIAMADPAFFEGTVPVPRLRITRLLDDVIGEVRPALVALLAGMVLALAAACASIANLVVARNTARARELAIRTALGASRRRLASTLLLEQALLALAASAGGVLLGQVSLGLLRAAAPAGMPRLDEVSLHAVAILGSAALVFVTGVLVAMLPAWAGEGRLTVVSSASRVHAGGRALSADRFRSVLVVGQVALAVVLLIEATLIGRSLIGLLRTHPGYRPDGVLTFQVGLPEGIWRQKGRQTRILEDLLARLEGTPGVLSAGTASELPMHGRAFGGGFRIEGRPPVSSAEMPRARLVIITPKYLDTLGARVVRGRGFTAADVLDAEHVVLVDETVARTYFPGEDPIGRRLTSIGRTPWTIVGVVEAVRMGALAAAPEPIVYYPYAQVGEVLAFGRFAAGVAVRTSGDPLAIVPLAREYVRAIDASIPVHNVQPLRERLDRTADQPRFYAAATALFAIFALTTAVVGTYGLMAYAVERRRLEFGVRRALGASEPQIAALVARRAAALAAAGLALGVPLAMAGGSLVQALLYGMRALDGASYLFAVTVVIAVIAAATWQPARRALRVDPAQALRVE